MALFDYWSVQNPILFSLSSVWENYSKVSYIKIRLERSHRRIACDAVVQ